MKKFFTAAALAILATGCASPPLADSSVNLEAKRFVPLPGHAVVYIYRDGLFGGGVSLSVLVDRQLVGATYLGRFMRLEVKPGTHLLVSPDNRLTMLERQFEAGKLYFFRHATSTTGVIAYGEFEAVDETTARRDITQCCELVKSFPLAN